MSGSKVETRSGGIYASLLRAILTSAGLTDRVGERVTPYGAGEVARPGPSPREKLVPFGEHRDLTTSGADRL